MKKRSLLGRPGSAAHHDAEEALVLRCARDTMLQRFTDR